MDLKESDILGNDISDHWYYSSKARAMTKMLDGLIVQAVLDVGAGSAFFSRYLLASTGASEAWCVDTSYSAEYDQPEGNKSIHFRRSIGSIDADLVLLMDVLEHVDDDIELLRSYVAKVPRGSKFLITVPAFQFLWSGHDDFLEHKRRYTLNQLEKTAQMSGLTVRRGAYYFGVVFPIAATMRIWQKIFGDSKSNRSQLDRHSPIINTLLKLLCGIELPMMKINRLAGLTAFCLAEKR